jgi:hypothetical protein
MPTTIVTQINQPCLATLTAAEIPNIPYAGIQIDTTAGEVEVWGIDVSCFCFTPADYANLLGIELLVQRNLLLDVNASGDDFGDIGNLEFYKIIRNNNQDYDKQFNFTTPVRLSANTKHGAWLFLRPLGAFVGLTRLVLNLRGNIKSTNQFPYVYR